VEFACPEIDGAAGRAEQIRVAIPVVDVSGEFTVAAG
jgi:hypothetical protein